MGEELGPAVDWAGPDGERQTHASELEEVGGGGGGGPLAGLEDVPAGDHVAGREVFEGNAGDRAHVEGIELDEIAGLRGLILARFADGS